MNIEIRNLSQNGDSLLLNPEGDQENDGEDLTMELY